MNGDTTAPGRFENTHWTTVLQAAHNPEDTYARDAFGRLYQIYSNPLKAFARRLGHKPEDAEDLTQGFFEHLLTNHVLANVDQAKGSFRSFLLRCFRNFLNRQWQKAHAQKRDPGAPPLSIDETISKTHFHLLPVDNAAPDKLYERDCFLALLEQAIARLRDQYQAEEKLELYEQLKPSLMGEGDALPYRELAARLNTTETALRAETSRMRRKLRKLLEQMLVPVSGFKADLTFWR